MEGTETAERSELVMIRECPFCGAMHTSPYVDELEAKVMACREKVPLISRGTLETWDDRDSAPVPPEVEAFTFHG